MRIALQSAELRRWPPELVPGVLVTTMIAVAVVWNRWQGISWQPSLMVWLASPIVLLVVSAVYAVVRPQPVIAEIAFWSALWLLYPVFATRLTYLSVAAGYPLADATLNDVDTALGFHWLEWAKFTVGHPLFNDLQRYSYLSYAWQPVLTIPVLAVCRPRYGNAKFLTSMLFAMLLTLLITTFTPAIGPAYALGLEPLPAPIIQALRATHGAQNLPYAGIVSFPSFHAVMAILFIQAHRGLSWTLPAVLVFNVLMLISIPYCGDHYLIDVAGGLAVAIATIRILRHMPPAFQQRYTG
jgi:hypothetical protein